jgi:undecaprenyl-phosphate 4-deoxy-4-formamido-L-arabinose transferase
MADAEMVSVVVPVYKSKEILPHLVDRLTRAFSEAGCPYEIICVCDCSPDGSWEQLVQIAKRDPHLKAVLLRRHFGYDSAIMAGFAHVRGNYVVTMDDDLQHAPEDIPKLRSALEQGYDVVYAHFPERRQHLLKNLGSWLNGLLGRIVLGKERGLYLSPFKIMRREVVDEVRRYVGPFPYVDGLLLTITASIGQVTVEHHQRFSGHGNHTLVPSLRIWLNHATGFSIIPLRLASYLGLLVSMVAFALIVFLIIWRLFEGQAPEGWASSIVLYTFLGGIQLLALGLVGEYLGRAYLTLSRFPQFVVKETQNLNESRSSGQ